MLIKNKFDYVYKKYLLLIIVFLFINPIIMNAQNFDYLIITPDIFADNSYWDTSLLMLQSSRGYHPLLITIEDGTSRDAIQSTIASYYQSNPIKYVLLVGSAKDGPAQVPRDTSILDLYLDHGTIKANADFANGNFIPFFAVTSNNPWNPPTSDVASDDPYVIDLTSHGSVYVGRIPVTSATEATNYVSKLMSYYQYMPAYLDGLNNEIIITTDVNHPTNGCTGELVTMLINDLKNNHISSQNNIVQLNVSENIFSCNPFDYCQSREELFEYHLNQGASIVSLMSTGGGPQNLAGWYWDNSGYDFTNKNTAMPFLVAPGCNMGEVNYPGVESSMRKLMTYYNGGIIGAIAPTNTSEQHPNGYLLNKFNDFIKINESQPLGIIFRILKNDIATNYPLYEFYFNSLVFFGDPSMLPSLFKHRSGSINASTTWNGNILIDNTVTLASGRTLTIKPGTKIYFKDGASLNINGTLSAVGTASQKILFNSDGITNTGLITFNGTGASNSVLNYAEIRNRSGIQCMNGANITIQNTLIDHCTHGIYIYGAAPTILHNNIFDPYGNGIYGETMAYGPLIKENTIKKITNNLYNYEGIYFTNSSANSHITGNDIQGFDYGFYFGGGGQSYFWDDNYVTSIPNNRFTNNVTGFCAAWGSYIMAGYTGDPSWCAYNSIYSNTSYDAKAYQNGRITAQFNWWGKDGAQLSTSSGGTIDASNPLNYDPWIPPQENMIVNKEPLNPGEGNDDIVQAISLEREGRIIELISLCKRMIRDNENTNFAISELIYVKIKHHINNIRDYLDSLAIANSPFKAKLLYYLAGLSMREGHYNLANILYNKIINEFPNSREAVDARFEKFFAALNIVENLSLAGQLLAELQGLGINDDDFLMRLEMAEYLYEQSGSNHMTKPTNSNEGKTEVKEYALFDNFPNPFNPTTTINFQLPQNGFVTLKIYDILGKEVAILVNEQKNQGRYSINFDASRLASGVYIYQLRVNDYVSSKKMLLLK